MTFLKNSQNRKMTDHINSGYDQQIYESNDLLIGKTLIHLLRDWYKSYKHIRSDGILYIDLIIQPYTLVTATRGCEAHVTDAIT